jgi:hypothetical protein
MSHFDQGPENDPNWRARFGLPASRPEPQRTTKIPNQIGLEGDITPPDYMAQLKLPKAPEPRVIFDRFGIKVETHRHRVYGMETHVTVKLPGPRRVFFDASYDTLVTARPAWFIAFGMVECAHTGWHARGQIIPVDTVPMPAPPKNIGYEHPINLANYT